VIPAACMNVASPSSWAQSRSQVARSRRPRRQVAPHLRPHHGPGTMTPPTPSAWPRLALLAAWDVAGESRLR
jgi:hypothetical protein